MAFASLLEHVGGMGRFQVVSVLLLSLPVFMMASHNLLQNFTAATSDHWCRLRPEANATGLDPEALLRVWVPRGERCQRFVTPQWWLLEANGSAPNSSGPETEPCGDGWTYDRSVFVSTIITEWDLVCSSRGLKQLAQSLYTAGVLAGGIVFGGLSDRFGRRSVLTWCHLQMATMGTCSSFAPTFTVYCLFRFLTGMAFSGIVLNSVSLSLEWMPTQVRALVGTFMGYCYTAGQFLLAGIAFAVPDWRQLQLAVSLPFFVFFLYSWWLTESARWLVMVGKSHQALRELQKVARINGKKEEGDKLDIEVKGPIRVPQRIPGGFYRGPLNVHPMDNCPSMAICIPHPLKHPAPPSIHLHHLSHFHHRHLHQSHPSLPPIHESTTSIPPSTHDPPPPLPPILPRPFPGQEGPQCPTPIPEPPRSSRP